VKGGARSDCDFGGKPEGEVATMAESTEISLTERAGGACAPIKTGKKAREWRKKRNDGVGYGKVFPTLRDAGLIIRWRQFKKLGEKMKKS